MPEADNWAEEGRGGSSAVLKSLARCEMRLKLVTSEQPLQSFGEAPRSLCCTAEGLCWCLCLGSLVSLPQARTQTLPLSVCA